MKKDRVRHVVGFILAPHRSYSSFNQYIENVETAKKEAFFPGLEVTYVDPWHEHPLFIEAVADRVKDQLKLIEETNPDDTLLIFTAHSIPMSMADQCKYHEEIETSSRLVAEKLGRARWMVAYQSRSGRPQDPWLEPDINQALRHAHSHEIQNVVVVPIGFLSDHAEVLYDLDFDAKMTANKSDLKFFRAETVMDHPKFIEMMYDVIQSAVSSK